MGRTHPGFERHWPTAALLAHNGERSSHVSTGAAVGEAVPHTPQLLGPSSTGHPTLVDQRALPAECARLLGEERGTGALGSGWADGTASVQRTLLFHVRGRSTQALARRLPRDALRTANTRTRIRVHTAPTGMPPEIARARTPDPIARCVAALPASSDRRIPNQVRPTAAAAVRRRRQSTPCSRSRSCRRACLCTRPLPANLTPIRRVAAVAPQARRERETCAAGRPRAAASQRGDAYGLGPVGIE